jgi:hypothetical protein
MSRSLLACLFFVFAMHSADARILRVGIDYPDFNSANGAAVAGDTLQIYGSHNGTATKRLVIIGFGYNFDVHPGMQAIGNDAPSQLGVNINAGADSTIVEGINGDVNIFAQKVIVRRCRASINIYNQTRSLNDIKIISCVFLSGGMVYNNNFPCTNIQVYNTILVGGFSMYNIASSGSIINCVPHFQGGANVLSLGQANFLVKNSIFYYSNSNANPNTVYESNFFIEGQPSPAPQGSNNRWNQSTATLFNRLGGTSDNPSYNYNASFDENWFLLKAGSPAIGGGTNAAGAPTDCGLFGGEPVYVYRISGVPAVPSIYKLTAPSSAATSDPYQVTNSVRSNN